MKEDVIRKETLPKLKGKTINNAYLVRKKGDSSEIVQLKLSDGTVYTIGIEGSSGADGEWYEWLVGRENGVLDFRK